VILHLIDGTEDDVVGAYRTIRRELADYGHGLADKPEIVGLNKIDAVDPDAIAGKCRALARAARPGTTVLALSGVSGAGIQPVLGALYAAIEAARADRAPVLVLAE
jgi:GTP-binding protein